MNILAAYHQGQRDREQGWPVINWDWTHAEFLAYFQGFSNPRVQVSQ